MTELACVRAKPPLTKNFSGAWFCRCQSKRKRVEAVSTRPACVYMYNSPITLPNGIAEDAAPQYTVLTGSWKICTTPALSSAITGEWPLVTPYSPAIP